MSTARVAVYIDFDNIVISRYDQVHRRGEWSRDGARHGSTARRELAGKLAAARVDVGAILDYASSFGSVVVSRAYADWSAPANAAYQRQLVDRAVDLTQLFPVTAGMKNGADIRLAVDVVEDLFRLADVTHVVIVAGDSDYIALAQRARRLGRTVVGIGVAGATSRALMAACDQFVDYDDLWAEQAEDEAAGDPAKAAAAQVEPTVVAPAEEPGSGTPGSGDGAAAPARAALRRATQLLIRAMRLVHAKHPDDEWLSFGEVKNQMLRLDPAFTEKPLGFGSFSDFVAARPSVVEVGRPAGGQPQIRLRPGH